MARSRVLRVGALNIKTHPHSESGYSSLLTDVFTIGKSVKIRGSSWGMLGTFQSDKDNDKIVHFGTIYKFLNIDPKDPWLNTLTKMPVKDKEGRIVQPIAENLKPNLKEIFYIFYPKHHRMFFESDLLPPKMAMHLMESLFRQKSIVNKYGNVDVEIETSIEAVEKILAIPILNKLEIKISKPNPGDVLDEDDEAKVFKRFDRVKARKLSEKWDSHKGQGLEPDEDIKMLMRVASSNGLITAEGLGANEQKITESTQSHPRIMKDRFNPDTQTELSFFKNMASRMYASLTRN
ncbi:MAG: DUF4747 family protein [Desulfobulbus sp.]|nr:DUF4747 family protein [Desulfobulbus sp.]